MNPGHSLDEIRRQIDTLDSELLKLITQRAACVKAAAAFKKDSAAVRAPDRVQQVVDKVRQQASAQGLSPEIAESIWRAMISAFIDYELQHHQHLTAGESR